MHGQFLYVNWVLVTLAHIIYMALMYSRLHQGFLPGYGALDTRAPNGCGRTEIHIVLYCQAINLISLVLCCTERWYHHCMYVVRASTHSQHPPLSHLLLSYQLEHNTQTQASFDPLTSFTVCNLFSSNTRTVKTTHLLHTPQKLSERQPAYIHNCCS